MLINWMLYITLVFYNAVDVWQTKLLLDLGAYEANSFMRYLMEYFNSFTPVIAYKAIMLMFLGVLLFLYSEGYLSKEIKFRGKNL